MSQSWKAHIVANCVSLLVLCSLMLPAQTGAPTKALIELHIRAGELINGVPDMLSFVFINIGDRDPAMPITVVVTDDKAVKACSSSDLRQTLRHEANRNRSKFERQRLGFVHYEHLQFFREHLPHSFHLSELAVSEVILIRDDLV